jgi:putative ABC transport system permease protein
MASLRGVWLHIRSLFRRRLDRDLEDELSFHAEMAAREYIESGMEPSEAWTKARRQFGNRTTIKEAGRDMFSLPRLDTFLQDIRYGARVLIKNPGFSSTAMITLALGIGVNVAIFSLVYGVLLRPLPYQSGDRLVVLHQQALGANQPNIPFSVKEIVDYREQNRTLDAIVEHHTMNFLLLRDDGAERVDTAVVSANFFDVLGVQPLLGRTFVASDETHGADAVLILSNEYWRKRHGSDPNIVGKVFQMNNRPHTVIGVLPPIPQYPVENDVYMPTSQCPTRSSQAFIENRRSRMMTAFGRLKPGAQVEQARADLSTVAQHVEQENRDAYPKDIGYGLTVEPLRKDLTRRAESTFFVLLGAAGLVLLIACANVANLLLARLLAVQRELALRMALGAGRLRLLRQLLTEGMLLSLAGGVLGLALAPATLRLLVKFAERFTTRSAEIKIDTPVLLFALLISVATGILFSLWPAFSSSGDVANTLKTGKSTALRSSHRLRGALVVAQIAVSFILLTGAGLLIRSFIRLQSVNPGFTSSQVLTLRLSPNFSRYTQPQQYRTLGTNVLREVAATSGVELVAMAANFPFNPSRLTNGPGGLFFRIEGAPDSGPRMLVDRNAVNPSYFQVIRQALVAGRLFTDQDHDQPDHGPASLAHGEPDRQEDQL